LSKGSTHYVWRRCRECGHVWRGMKTTKSCWRKDRDGTEITDGKQRRVYCGSGRLIRYPEHDEEVQQILKEMRE